MRNLDPAKYSDVTVVASDPVAQMRELKRQQEVASGSAVVADLQTAS